MPMLKRRFLVLAAGLTLAGAAAAQVPARAPTPGPDTQVRYAQAVDMVNNQYRSAMVGCELLSYSFRGSCTSAAADARQLDLVRAANERRAIATLSDPRTAQLAIALQAATALQLAPAPPAAGEAPAPGEPSPQTSVPAY